MILMINPRDGNVLWYIHLCMYDHDFDMDFHLMVMLRSTTGPYGWLLIEVAYGRWYFHSTEAVWEMIAREEWLGCRHDTSPMFDMPGSTLVWAPCILFFGFQDIKTYVYLIIFVYCLFLCFLPELLYAHTCFLLSPFQVDVGPHSGSWWK